VRSQRALPKTETVDVSLRPNVRDRATTQQRRGEYQHAEHGDERTNQAIV